MEIFRETRGPTLISEMAKVPLQLKKGNTERSLYKGFNEKARWEKESKKQIACYRNRNKNTRAVFGLET